MNLEILSSFHSMAASIVWGQYISNSFHILLKLPNSWTKGFPSWRLATSWWIWKILAKLFWFPYISWIASHRSNDDYEKLKISARFLSMEFRIRDTTSWSMDNHASYSGSFTSGKIVEPFINPNLDFPLRAIVTALDQGKWLNSFNNTQHNLWEVFVSSEQFASVEIFEPTSMASFQVIFHGNTTESANSLKIQRTCSDTMSKFETVICGNITHTLFFCCIHVYIAGKLCGKERQSCT